VDEGGQYMPLSHVTRLLGVVQYDPAGHVFSEVEPRGQKEPIVVHATLVLGFAQ
jgi:hypothetical protein